MAVRVAVEAGHTAARLFRAPVLGLVELLLRKRRHQQAQALELFGIQYPVEQLIVVHDRHELALRDVTEIRSRRQVDGRRKLRQQAVSYTHLTLPTNREV